MLDFGGGAISGDGGLLLLGQLDRRLGLTKQAGKLLDGFETRQRGKIWHLAADMFRQRVLSLAAGHEDLNDQAEKVRYRERSTVERCNSELKDNYGARNVRVRGHLKVFLHLMLGVVALTSKALFNMLC